MDDANSDVKEVFRRVEVLTGPGRRRRWSAEEKARIVEESLMPGARVSDVARRWQVCSQQVFSWRREARGTVIEVKLAGAVVRVASGMDGAMLTEVLRAVRASATRT